MNNNNGCTMHILEAGFDTRARPCIVLLHGFPELAFSWRKQMLSLAAAGFYVIAPDQRGYGRSSGTDVSFDDDLLPYTYINHVSDTLGLVHALGYSGVAAIVGHDYGSPVAAWCALVRPDVFRSVVLWGATPALPLNTANARKTGRRPVSTNSCSADPRKYFGGTTRGANSDIWHCPQGVHDFLRAYYHVKSGDGREQALPAQVLGHDSRYQPTTSWSSRKANHPGMPPPKIALVIGSTPVFSFGIGLRSGVAPRVR
jgi:pimeloyl-ACP methyl ester carboxylesterase